MEEKRKKIIIFFSIVVIALAADALVPNLAVKVLAALTYLAFSIVTLVYSIQLVKKKDYAFGVTFLALSAFVILLFLVAFIVGFIIGLSEGIKQAQMAQLS